MVKNSILIGLDELQILDKRSDPVKPVGPAVGSLLLVYLSIVAPEGK